jgi:hypothetical protein
MGPVEVAMYWEGAGSGRGGHVLGRGLAVVEVAMYWEGAGGGRGGHVLGRGW